MKIGIIGYGYWGKILHKNISELYSDIDILISDPEKGYNGQCNLMECDKIFIATPATTHREIADLYLSNGKDVFCEKPLATNRADVYALYKISEYNNCKLFVDWTFTFNAAVNFIKENYYNNKFGNLLSVRMNRINKGPVRGDVDAKWDLSSHDVSILQYVFKQKCLSKHWINLKRNNNNLKNDTCIGVLKYETYDALLYSSWEYSIKNRDCIFEFENGILYWDDITQNIIYNNENIWYDKGIQPLKKSIEIFLSGNFDQKKLTVETTDILLD
jgi:predicted dehydrogenase